MPENLGDAILELRTDDRKLRRGLRTAEGGANRLNAVFKTVGATIAAAFSVRAIGRFASEVIKAADAQIQAERQLATALEVTGQATAGALDGLKDFASNLQSITTVGDEAALEMLQVATNMGLTAEQSKLAVKEAIGVSAAFGIAETSAIRYTAALQQGDTTMLNRYIPTLRQVEDDAERVALAHDILGGAFQGAVTEAESGLGPYRQLQNRLGDLREVVGIQLLESLQDVISELKTFAETEEAEAAARRLGDAMATAVENVVELTGAIRSLLELGQPLADFLSFGQIDPDPERLRTTAAVIERIERFLTLDLPEETAIAGRVRDLADSIEEAAEASRNAKGDFDLSGVLEDANDEIDRLMDEGLERIKREAPDAADAIEEAGEAIETFSDIVREAGQENLESFDDQLRRVRESLDPVERATNAYKVVINTLGDAVRLGKIEQEDFNRLVGLAEDELNEAKEAARDFSEEIKNIPTISEDAFKDLPRGVAKDGKNAADELGRLFEDVMDDIGRALAQAIISGDVDSAIDAFGRALEAAVADAMARGIAKALAGAALTTVAAASIVGVILARLFEVGPFEKDTGRRLTGDVTIGAGGVTTPPDFESASRETRAAFAALERAILESLAQLQETLRFEIPQGFDVVLQGIQAQVKDGVTRFNVIINRETGRLFDPLNDVLDDLEASTVSFESEAAAAGFALQQFLTELIEQGQEFDAAVTEAIQGFGAGLDPTQAGFENFADVLGRVQELADQAAMSLDGVTEVELALQRIGPSAQALTRELTSLGLSAAQTSRLVGGQIVQSFQALRQQITGEQLSVARRREIAQANAELFNAELELQIARLEAERDALLAEAGLTQEQIKLMNSGLAARSAGLQAEARLEGNVIDARSRFVQASAKVFQGELGVMQGFTQAGAGIVRTGLEAVGGFVDVIGTIAPEIAKQVQAIQKVIDALRRIGTIRPGDIRIPGVGRIPSPGPVGRPGDGIDRAPRAARAAREELDRLIRSLDELASETIRSIDALEGAVGGLEALRDEITLATQAAPQQLGTVRARLEAAAARFRAGDISAAADVERLGRQFAQLTGQQFSSLTAGFQSRQRFLEDLLNQTIRSGEDQLETERDLLESLNDRQADLLEQLVALGVIAQDQVDETRSRGEEQTGATRDVEDRVKEMNRAMNKLARAVEKLAREAARNQQAA